MNSVISAAANILTKRERPVLVAATGLFFYVLDHLAQSVPLEKVLQSHRGGVWGSETLYGTGYPVLRSTNMRGTKADVTNAAWCDISTAQAQDCELQTGDILVTKSSGSDDLVGKAALFVQPDNSQTYLFSNFTLRLRPDKDTILPEYLAWFLRSPQALAWRFDAQQNAVGLRNLQTKSYLHQRIPIPEQRIQKLVVSYLDALENNSQSALEVELPPPLAEQRRIVARIEELAAKIEEARGLRRAAVEEGESLWTNGLQSAFSRIHSKSYTIEDVCEAIIDNLHSTPKYDGDSYLCIRSQDIGWGTINYNTALRTSEAEFLHRIQRGEPQAGDIVYVREGDVGRSAIVDGSQRFCLGQRVMMFRPNQNIILPRFMLLQMLSPQVLKDQIIVGKTGTTSHHVNIGHLRQVRLLLPPLDEQRRIVAYLDGLQAKVDALRALQAATQAELDALLPAVLDKAFRGEL